MFEEIMTKFQKIKYERVILIRCNVEWNRWKNPHLERLEYNISTTKNQRNSKS